MYKRQKTTELLSPHLLSRSFLTLWKNTISWMKSNFTVTNFWNFYLFGLGLDFNYGDFEPYGGFPFHAMLVHIWLRPRIFYWNSLQPTVFLSFVIFDRIQCRMLDRCFHYVDMYHSVAVVIVRQSPSVCVTDHGHTNAKSQFFVAQIKLPIPNEYLASGYKDLVFCKNHGWIIYKNGCWIW
jgi:hypothetical protein